MRILFNAPTLALCVLLVCQPLSTMASSESEYTLTLAGAIHKTLTHHPRLQQFNYREQALTALVEGSRQRPGYALSLELENIAGSGEFQGGSGAETTLSLSSVIELGNKRQRRTDLAAARLGVMRTSQQVEALDILGQLTKHYIAALATQAQLQLSHEANEFGKALVATITKRVKRGAAPQTELIRAQAALAQIRIRSLGFKQQLLREKAELAIFWGNPLEKTPPLSGDLYVFAHARPLEELQAQLLESPAVAQLISSERLQNSSIALQKTQNAADITWSMGIRRLQQSADSAFTFGLSIPLGSHRRNNSQLRATQADALALRSYNNEQRLRLQQQLFAAYSQRQQFLDAFALLRDEVIPLLTQALALTREAYDRGRLSYQDLHIAQQELLSARHQKINTAKTVLLNQALVEQLTAQPLTL